MRWNSRLDIPPPNTLDSTIKAYLRGSANGTVSVANTMWVCAVSLGWRTSRPRTAAPPDGGTGTRPRPLGASNHPWVATSSSSAECSTLPAAAITQLPGTYACPWR